MHFSSHLLNEAAVAVCWTLVHSLWQGLLLVILTGLVLISTRRSRPVIRYRMLSLLMVFFVAVAAVTFVREWRVQPTQVPAGQALVGGAVESIVPAAGERGGVAPVVVGGRGIAAVIGSCVAIAGRVNMYLSAHAVLIVLVWLVILGVRLGRMWWALNYTGHICRREGRPLPEYWTVRLEELSGRLGLRSPILLLESAIMKAPMAFGHLKPVIFIPIGLFAKLPPEQAEVILLHELAHIKRDDYLMNLLQGLVEHLFFFNPALLWLSALIREERENCCDEIAIAGNGDKKQLVRALIWFRELTLNADALYGMAFAGRRNVFVNRIARIVQGKSKGLTAAEGVFFGFSVLLIAFLAMAFKQGGRQTTGNVPGVVVAAQDTLPPSRDRMITLDVDLPHGKQVLLALHNDRLYRITQVNGVVTALTIGDNPIPADKIEGYKPTIRRIYEHLDRVRIDKVEQEASEDPLARSQVDLRRQEEAIENSKRELLQRMKDLQAAQVDVERQHVDKQALENLLRDREVEMQKLQKDLIHREYDLEQAQKAQMFEGLVPVLEEAVKQRIVSDVAEIRSLHLTRDTLIINGKEQSAAMQGVFRKKFLLTPQMEFHFDSSDK